MLTALCRFCQVEEEDTTKAIAPLQEKMKDMSAFTKARTVLMVQTVEAVKAEIADAPIAEIERTHAPVTILLDWLTAAIEVAGASLECRKAAKAAAEEKGDEYTEQVEDEITDKPEEAAEEPAAEE